ncbi:Fe-S cluster assembly protein SufD, partial [Mesorhizobium sp. M7A.F.Ca.CA.001.09.2.1]
MNMHAQPQRTPAETALIDAFGDRLSLLPGDGAVMLKRDDAIETIKHGLPTRRVESWHYTDLRRLLNTVPDFDPAALAKVIAPIVDGSTVVSILNGKSDAKAPVLEGVSFQRLSEKLVDGSAAAGLDPYGSDDAIGALNTAFVADGYFVDIADGVELEKPVELQNLQAGGQTHVRLAVRVGAGAKAVIVE